MVYTVTYTQPLKNKPFVYSVTRLNGKALNTKKLKLQDHDPKEDEWPRDDRPYEGPVEINDPEPLYIHDGTGPEVIHDFGSKKAKVKYRMSGDYIEVPGGTESVTWTDEDGQTYEVDVGDLIDYDGDDGEIQYTSGKSKIIGKRRVKKKFNHAQLQLAMIKAQMIRPRVYS